jgi:AcrR family transcriptional regulator
MANPRFRRLSLEQQEAFLTAAAEEFVQHGYASASMNRIVERAGSSKGALYYYFENKADLLATVVEEAYGRALAEIHWPAMDELTAETFWDRVYEVTGTWLDLNDLDHWSTRVLRAFYRLREEPEARDATSGLMDAGVGEVRAFLARGRELGTVRTDIPFELLVEMYVAADTAGDRWIAERWTDFSPEERATLFAARVDMARDMLDPAHGGGDR